MKITLILFNLILFSIYSNAIAASGLDSKDFALSVCLKNNYSKITMYETSNLKDYSHFDTGKTPSQDFRLITFVRKETRDYYLENLPIHSEVNPPPYNAIFQRCMEFYKSKKLDNFIKNNKPRASD